MRSKLAIVATLVVLGAMGCTKTRSCKTGTVLLTVDFGATSADQLQLDISVAGGMPRTTVLPHTPTSSTGTVEIDFAGAYPSNASITVVGTALSGQMSVGTASTMFTATPGCTTATLTFGGVSTEQDMSMPGSDDMAGGGSSSDLAGVVVPAFYAGRNYATGKQPGSVDVGDFNRDGHRDFVVVNVGSNSMSVFMNDGTGHFGMPNVYPVTGGQLGSIATGDFDGKNGTDVALTISNASTGAGTIIIFLNDGTGSLKQAATTYSVGVIPVQLKAANLSQDAFVDLAVVCTGGGSATTGTVNVLINQADGTGSFAADNPITVGAQPTSIAVANFIGLRDIAVLNSNSNTTGTATITILQNNGNGTSFSAQGPYSVGVASSSMTAGDFDGKNGPDLVVNGSTDALMLLNNGAGAFNSTSHTNSASPCGPNAIDMNGDGSPDLVCQGNLFASIQLNKADGTGTLLAQTSFPVGAAGFAAADFDGDGATDLVLTGSGEPVATVLLNDKKGSLVSALLVPNFAAQYQVTSGDFNNDKKLDFVTAGSGPGVWVALGDGTGHFGMPISYPTSGTSNPNSIATGDFNNDKFTDVVAGNSGSGGGVFVFLAKSDSSGALNAFTTVAAGTKTQAVVVADFDGKNGPDIATGDADGKVYILLNNGSGQFAAGVGYATGGTPNSIAAADLNQDGSIDIAVTGAGTTGQVIALYNNGSGVFNTVASHSYPVGSLAYAIAAGDVSGDGQPDLIASNFGDGTVSILVNKADQSGTFTKLTDVTVDVSPRRLTVADVDADGKLDILVAGSGADNLDLLWNRGGNSFMLLTFAAPYQTWDVTSGDYNGDALPDVVYISPSYPGFLLNVTK